MKAILPPAGAHVCMSGCGWGGIVENCHILANGMLCPYNLVERCGACFRLLPKTELSAGCCRECNDSFDGDEATSTDRCPLRPGAC